jgi:hypothetical protein
VHTPGVELRVHARRPSPLLYGLRDDLSVFRQNFTVYEQPHAWHRMAYCTACLDGPVEAGSVVLAWGAAAAAGGAAAAPTLVSGGARGLDRLTGAPALLVVPEGLGAWVVFNFNPVHRDLNRSDHRLLWNAILHHQALVR